MAILVKRCRTSTPVCSNFVFFSSSLFCAAKTVVTANAFLSQRKAVLSDRAAPHQSLLSAASAAATPAAATSAESAAATSVGKPAPISTESTVSAAEVTAWSHPVRAAM